MENLAELEPQGQDSTSLEEDRILRLWTPILLRTIVIAAMVALVAGLLMAVATSPHQYVERYNAAQLGRVTGGESFFLLVASAFTGEPRAMLMVGLYLLTLVPLVRVAFCLGLFVKIRDYPYVAFTAYVLAALIFGALLGRIG